MPRVNPLRSLANERNVAERIAFERERLGMSYEGLAKRMAAAGAPLQATAIYKIEKGDPPRRITVDELVAFARVFEFDVEDLLLPMGMVLDSRASELVRQYQSALNTLAHAISLLIDTAITLVQLETSTKESDREVVDRVVRSLPGMMISYPMGPERDPRTPDPIHEDFRQLSDHIYDYARWRVGIQRGE